MIAVCLLAFCLFLLVALGAGSYGFQAALRQRDEAHRDLDRLRADRDESIASIETILRSLRDPRGN